MVREIVMLSIAARGKVAVAKGVYVIVDAGSSGVMLSLAALDKGSGNRRL